MLLQIPLHFKWGKNGAVNFNVSCGVLLGLTAGLL